MSLTHARTSLSTVIIKCDSTTKWLNVIAVIWLKYLFRFALQIFKSFAVSILAGSLTMVYSSGMEYDGKDLGLFCCVPIISCESGEKEKPVLYLRIRRNMWIFQIIHFHPSKRRLSAGNMVIFYLLSALFRLQTKPKINIQIPSFEMYYSQYNTIPRALKSNQSSSKTIRLYSAQWIKSMRLCIHRYIQACMCNCVLCVYYTLLLCVRAKASA